MSSFFGPGNEPDRRPHQARDYSSQQPRPDQEPIVTKPQTKPPTNPTAKLPVSFDHRYIALCHAVRACWQAIGDDTLQAFDETGETCSNQDAIEMCLDADRLLSYPGGAAGADANAFVRECAGTQRYAELVAALAKSCHIN